LSKYKFDLAPKVNGFVEWQLEHYHEDKSQLEQYKNDMIPSATASYSLTGGTYSGSPGNPTERIGIKIATSPYILMTERSVKAIDVALKKCDETDKQLIELIYWKRSYTVTGAGHVIGLSQTGTYGRVNKILRLIALEMGLTDL
jgi:RinA family phage transcriptional activator